MGKKLDDLFDVELLNDLEAQVGTGTPNFNERVADLLIAQYFFNPENFTNETVSRSEMIDLVEEYFGY